MSRRTNRRQFIQQTGLAGLGFWVAGGLTPALSRSPNEKLNIACIGVGGKGDSDIDQAGNLGNVVAICDIDDNTLDKKGQEVSPGQEVQRLPQDVRRDGQAHRRRDRQHARPHARRRRHDGHEDGQARLLPEAADAHRLRGPRAARGGAASTRSARRWATRARPRTVCARPSRSSRPAASGRCTEVHVWTNRPIWPQAPKLTKRPEPKPVPPHVHWDLCLGPAPERPYASGYHPFTWRGWWDFGTGALGDMACHTANMAFRALKLGYPTSIVAESGEINPETYPAWATITFQFPARGDMPAVQVRLVRGPSQDGKKILPPTGTAPRREPVRTAARCWSATRACSTRRTTTARAICLLPEEGLRRLQEAGDDDCRATAAATTA